MAEILGMVRRLDLRGLLVEPTTNGLLQFLRYCLVGGVATVVDWSVLYVLTAYCGIYHLVSSVASFVAGLVANFVLSKALVFAASDARGTAATEFLGYAAIGAAGLAMTEAILFLLTDCLSLHFMLSKAVATVVVLGWNYVARKRLLYR